MAPINKNPNMSKKQTGTVPKSASSVSSETTAASSTRQSGSSSSRKNTEIVAPTRRELKEINDYLLSVAEQTKQQNSGGSSTHLDTSCFDLDNFQENQRFCWPVRPIPRRNICNKDIPYNQTGIPTTPTTNVLPTNFHVNTAISNNNSCGGGSNLNPAAAVGVVIPTTPNTSTNINQHHLNGDEANINQQYFDFDNDLSWEQRLKFIQYFWSLTSKSSNKTSETRAQSVTSIHTMSGPTTPTYEELQSKLESSNRNIQNIKDQKQQLLKLQQTAKQHLDDMEKVRNQTQNGSAPTQYESVEHVQSDMANLVNRMKYLTSFIQGQHELSNLLGDDGPEILAEQEALQRKLEELKTQRIEMKNLVSELQEINTAAERSCQMQQEGTPPRVVPIEYQRVVPIELVGAAKSQTHSPIPYQQQNGVHNGLETRSIPEEAISDKNEEEISNTITETNDLIQQKVADINAMKGQLKRLKEMMETVRLIEEKSAGKSTKEIGIDDESTEVQPSGFKNHNENYTGEASEEEDLCEKIQMLQAVTEDLRSQTETITSERNRLKAIKDEMMRQKQILQQNASQPEEGSLRILNNIQTSKEAEKDSLKSEYEAKKKEFETLCERLNSDDASRETEMEDEIHEPKIVRRNENKREQESYYSENWRVPVVSSGSSMRLEKQSVLPQTPSRGKDSADSGAVDVHGVASVEAGSLQSGSSRSFSMPPPMRSLNNREPPWRKSSQDNSQSQYENYGHPVAPPPPPPAIQSQIWNPYYQHYNMHYAQQFSPHHCYHARDCSFTHHGQGNIGTMANLNANQQVTAQNNSTVVGGDPVLLQQFIQTQQMLINSVCQCNQLLWHQQREINNLNNAVLLLQERLLNPTSNHELISSGTSNRADSLPPNSATVSNNLYPSGNRAQSEQPNHSFPCQATHPPISPGRSTFQSYNFSNSFQHNRRNMANIQQGNHLMSSQAAYNFAAVDQGSSVFGGSNNDTTPTHQQNTNFLNNDIPNSINTNQPHSAAPIFMHHHNNTINSSGGGQGLYPNNNSNLLSSLPNCLNSSTPVNVNQDTTGNASSSVLNNSISNAAVAAAAALNNQVPPGNRANNYWDNFRSYSRQNLLSTNSCKSNEDQNQQQLNSSPGGINTPINTNSNGLRNLQQLIETGSGSTSMNNLAQPTFDNKYIHNFRNQINMNTVGGQQQQQQQSQQTVNVLNGCELDGNISQAPLSLNNLEQSNVSLSQQVNQQPSQSEHLNDELINFNNNSNTVAAIFGSPDFRNMNFNFGANELRKKIPIKTSCNAKRLRQTQSAPLNGSFVNNQRLLSQSSLLASSNGENNFQQPTQQQINQNLDHNATDSAEGAVGIDETSDEIKRNLLVNALKNDKFTSKFFESLKEDVYREVYSVILATECHPHYLNQFFKELLLVPTSDPVRNIVMQAIHDLYKRSTTNEMGPVDGYNDLDFPNENNDMNQMNVDSSPIMQNNDDLEEASTSAPDNNRDNEIMHGFLNSPELRRLAYKIMFESSSPTRIEKSKKSSLKYCGANFPESSKIPNEFYRPDYELVNHIMNTIRSSMRSHNIDDNTMIRIAKLTFSTLENLSSTLGRTKIQIDRTLISPKELYKKMKSFEIHNRESFLVRYEAYLQTVFVMKVVNEDANNVNLANKKSRENIAPPSVMTTSNTLSLSNDDVQVPRRHPQPCKSNIPAVELELNLTANGIRKNITHEPNTETLAAQTQSSQCNQQRNITSRDVTLIFSSDQSELNSSMMQEQHSSPCLVNGNIMNEDLAEADQICSSSNNTIDVAAAMMPGTARGSFTSENLPKRGGSEHTMNDHGTEKEDCEHSNMGHYQDGTRDVQQPTSTIDRENLEDGYDGLAYIGFHTDESNSEVIIGPIDNADCHHPTDENHAILNGPDSACALVFPTINNDEIAGNSEAYAIPDSTNNNNNNSHSFGDTNSKRNSVP